MGQTSWSDLLVCRFPGLRPGVESETPPAGRSETCPTSVRNEVSPAFLARIASMNLNESVKFAIKQPSRAAQP